MGELKSKKCHFSTDIHESISLYSRYQRIAARRGGKRLRIAVAHTMLVAIYHILKEKVPYCDLGADHYSNMNQEKMIKRNLRSLEKLGVNVIIQPS